MNVLFIKQEFLINYGAERQRPGRTRHVVFTHWPWVSVTADGRGVRSVGGVCVYTV